LYECETWSLTLREEHELVLLEKRVLRRTSGSNRQEVMGGWRISHLMNSKKGQYMNMLERCLVKKVVKLKDIV
jgi:hypothetical protein